MNIMAKYICQESNHNKFWEYDVNGFDVSIKWGRIGGNVSSQKKSFSSNSSMQSFIQSKIREKESKDYKKVDEDKFEKENKIASNIGTRNKINRMFPVVIDDKIKEVPSYNEGNFIFVEMMNSWTKEKSFYVFNHKIGYEIYEYKSNGSYKSKNSIISSIQNGLILAIDELINKISIQIEEYNLHRKIDMTSSVVEKKKIITEFARKICMEHDVEEDVVEKVVTSFGKRMVSF